MTHSARRISGFTIIEVVVIIVVVSILTAITVVSYSAVTDNAKKQTVKTDAQTAAVELNKYKADNGGYPENLDVLGDIAAFDSNFQYNYNSADGTYCLTASIDEASAYIVSGNMTAKEGACESSE